MSDQGSDSRKRKRDDYDPPRITFRTPGRTFERLLTESSLESVHSAVIKKLKLNQGAKLTLVQLRDGDIIDLEDADDFDALRSFAYLSGHATVRVTISDVGGTNLSPPLTQPPDTVTETQRVQNSQIQASQVQTPQTTRVSKPSNASTTNKDILPPSAPQQDVTMSTEPAVVDAPGTLPTAERQPEPAAAKSKKSTQDKPNAEPTEKADKVVKPRKTAAKANATQSAQIEPSNTSKVTKTREPVPPTIPQQDVPTDVETENTIAPEPPTVTEKQPEHAAKTKKSVQNKSVAETPVKAARVTKAKKTPAKTVHATQVPQPPTQTESSTTTTTTTTAAEAEKSTEPIPPPAPVADVPETPGPAAKTKKPTQEKAAKSKKTPAKTHVTQPAHAEASSPNKAPAENTTPAADTGIGLPEPEVVAQPQESPSVPVPAKKSGTTAKKTKAAAATARNEPLEKTQETSTSPAKDSQQNETETRANDAVNQAEEAVAPPEVPQLEGPKKKAKSKPKAKDSEETPIKAPKKRKAASDTVNGSTTSAPKKGKKVKEAVSKDVVGVASTESPPVLAGTEVSSFASPPIESHTLADPSTLALVSEGVESVKQAEEKQVNASAKVDRVISEILRRNKTSLPQEPMLWGFRTDQASDQSLMMMKTSAAANAMSKQTVAPMNTRTRAAKKVHEKTHAVNNDQDVIMITRATDGITDSGGPALGDQSSVDTIVDGRPDATSPDDLRVNSNTLKDKPEAPRTPDGHRKSNEGDILQTSKQVPPITDEPRISMMKSLPSNSGGVKILDVIIQDTDDSSSSSSETDSKLDALDDALDDFSSPLKNLDVEKDLDNLDPDDVDIETLLKPNSSLIWRDFPSPPEDGDNDRLTSSDEGDDESERETRSRKKPRHSQSFRRANSSSSSEGGVSDDDIDEDVEVNANWADEDGVTNGLRINGLNESRLSIHRPAPLDSSQTILVPQSDGPEAKLNGQVDPTHSPEISSFRDIDIRYRSTSIPNYDRAVGQALAEDHTAFLMNGYENGEMLETPVGNDGSPSQSQVSPTQTHGEVMSHKENTDGPAETRSVAVSDLEFRYPESDEGYTSHLPASPPSTINTTATTATQVNGMQVAVPISPAKRVSRMKGRDGRLTDTGAGVLADAVPPSQQDDLPVMNGRGTLVNGDGSSEKPVVPNMAQEASKLPSGCTQMRKPTTPQNVLNKNIKGTSVTNGHAKGGTTATARVAGNPQNGIQQQPQQQQQQQQPVNADTISAVKIAQKQESASQVRVGSTRPHSSSSSSDDDDDEEQTPKRLPRFLSASSSLSASQKSLRAIASSRPFPSGTPKQFILNPVASFSPPTVVSNNSSRARLGGGGVSDSDSDSSSSDSSDSDDAGSHIPKEKKAGVKRSRLKLW